MSTFVWISREQLVDASACPAGMALFESLAAIQGRRRKVRVRWDALSWLWLDRGTGFSRWLYEHGIVPMPSFGGANLARANLARANLGGAYLGGAYLGGANLGGANLARAYLGGAYLGGAYLGGANLARANLGGANLARANLGGANLGGAYLGGAYLGGWERGPDGYARRVQ